MPKWEVRGYAPNADTTRRLYSKIIGSTIESQIRAEREKRENILGPKKLFFKYLNEDKIPLEQAIEKVIQQFPVYNRDIIMSWLSEGEPVKDNKADEERGDDER